jgi:ADP-ribose pyrophosphatase YjhB (NUDIX family)
VSASARVTRHFTASAFVVHEGRTLLLLHSEKRLWLPPGGHVELDEAPATAAAREVWEETGLRVEIVSRRVPEGAARAAPCPEASLEVEIEPGHVHLDLVYFARIATDQPAGPLRPNSEAAALRWWTAAEVRSSGDSRLPGDVAALALLALRAIPTR